MAKTWAESQRDYETVCNIIDSISTPDDFYKAMDKLSRYNLDLVNSVREAKACFNSAQYA